MTPSLHAWRSAAAGLAAALLCGGCELVLHEVQQAESGDCDTWQAGCPAVDWYAGGEAAHPTRVDVERLDAVSAAIEAPYRRCDTIGLVCQGRIIGDVLWDRYVMVLAGESDAASTTASAERAVPTAEAPHAPAAAAPAQAQPVSAPGRIVRTHGTRAGEPATAAPSR